MTNSELSAWSIVEGQAPIVAAALHAGHHVRNEVQRFMHIGNGVRRREEDPYTDEWTNVAQTRIVAHRSRFELDLNRPREKAVYLKPEDAWGLHVWNASLDKRVLQRSLAIHTGFYAEVLAMFKRIEKRHGSFVVLDLHSYNHRRGGPDAPADAVEMNPDVNIGTGSMDRAYWGPLVERFIADLSCRTVLQERLDVRENIRFRGGYLAQFIHERFAGTGCVLAIEFKKIFMNEWTGQINRTAQSDIKRALASVLPGIRETLTQRYECRGA